MSAETHLSELEEEMAQAVASEDFETAAALRDQIEQIRRDVRVMEQPDADAPQASYLKRQEPGKMGLGTDQSSYVPPPCSGDFGDVPCPSQFADWIEQLAAESITGGCGGGNYCPATAVRRDQMAAFLYNTFDLP